MLTPIDTTSGVTGDFKVMEAMVIVRGDRERGSQPGADRRVVGSRVRTMGLASVVLAGVLAVAPLPPGAVERWYSTGAYPVIERALTTVSGVTPFAWFDVWLLAALGWLLRLWSRPLVAPRGERWRGLGRVAWVSVVAASVGYLIFLACWGLNYRREPLTARLVLTRPAPDTAAVVALGEQAVRGLSMLHAHAHRSGWIDDSVDDARLRAAAAHVQALLGLPRVATSSLKPTLLRWLFRWQGVDA
ncbi:MAG: DUF3810 domain-containing protein, partial [Gammaproteobacteria bacterium]|nr:DUF3810 domain-containing protein [Gammaproteobacteria bacterium]